MFGLTAYLFACNIVEIIDIVSTKCTMNLRQNPLNTNLGRTKSPKYQARQDNSIRSSAFPIQDVEVFYPRKIFPTQLGLLGDKPGQYWQFWSRETNPPISYYCTNVDRGWGLISFDRKIQRVYIYNGDSDNSDRRRGGRGENP